MTHKLLNCTSLAVLMAVLVAALLGSCGGGKGSSPARLTLLVSGNTMGYLRNCGCQSGQYGGELRRARLLKNEREEALKPRSTDKEKDFAVLTLDLGSSLKGENYLERLYSRQVLRSMAHTGYDMLGLGKTDLTFGQEDLLSYITQAQAQQKQESDTELPLCAVNLHFDKPLEGTDCSADLNKLIQKYRIIDVGNGFKVGLIHAIDEGILLESEEDGEPVSKKYGFTISSPAKAAEQVLMQHGKEAQYWILTLGDGVEGSSDPQPVADLKDLDLVIGFTKGNPNQTAKSEGVVLPYFLPGPILKARDLLKIDVEFPSTADGDVTVSSQALAVGSNINGDEYVLGLIDEIFPEIEKAEKEQDSLVANILHPTYVGQDTCATCHPNIVASMKLTKHMHSYESLVKRGKEDPEQKNAAMDSSCLRCHVTGYSQSTGLPDKHGGWTKLTKEDRFARISCEVCHGPGEFHVMLKTGLKDIAGLSEEGRNEHGLQKASLETCLRCHDEENSPEFMYESYWEKIRHSLDMPAPEAETTDASSAPALDTQAGEGR